MHISVGLKGEVLSGKFHNFPLCSQQTPLFAAIVQYQTECAHSDVKADTWVYIDVKNLLLKVTI
jgi:hypothetical protein